MKRFISRKDDPQAKVIRQNARQYIDLDLDYNKSWVIEIKEYRKKRSLDQNAYIHAVPLKIISDQTGYTMDEIKEYLCGEFMGWQDYEVRGKQMQRPLKTTSQMTTLEMTNFIEWMQWFGSSELNLNIPSPNEWSGE